MFPAAFAAMQLAALAATFPAASHPAVYDAMVPASFTATLPAAYAAKQPAAVAATGSGSTSPEFPNYQSVQRSCHFSPTLMRKATLINLTRRQRHRRPLRSR